MISTGNEFQAPGTLHKSISNTPVGWNKPKPEKLPRPGYWPFLMALGIVFILWGLALGFNEVFSTMIIISGVGLIIFIISLAGWIGDLRDERKNEHR